MWQFTLTFWGCKKGAIGLCYQNTATVRTKNNSLDEARLKLYEKYDHIIGVRVDTKEEIRCPTQK